MSQNSSWKPTGFLFEWFSAPQVKSQGSSYAVRLSYVPEIDNKSTFASSLAKIDIFRCQSQFFPTKDKKILRKSRP